jgi:hypothetical protein
MEMLIAGAIEHGLPQHYVEHLRSIPTVPQTAEGKQVRQLLETLKRHDP